MIIVMIRIMMIGKTMRVLVRMKMRMRMRMMVWIKTR